MDVNEMNAADSDRIRVLRESEGSDAIVQVSVAEELRLDQVLAEEEVTRQAQQLRTDGRIIDGINMLLDITERKRAEEATARLAAIVESSDDAIISKDLNGVISSWNKGAEQIFGYTALEAIGRPITMLIPSDRLGEEPKIIECLKRGERVDHFETRRVRKDGSLVDISLTISPVRGPDGNVVGASKIARDITERKRAEAGSALLASIVQSSDDAIISKDLNGVISSWNKGAEQIFGYTAQEAIGRPVTMLIPSDRLGEEPKILASIRRGETVAHYETVRRRKDGTNIDISLTISPVRDESGHIIGASKIARDITGRKRAEEALHRLKNELEQRVAERTHELAQSEDRLRALATELNLAEQRERKRLALELHDHLQQILVLGRLMAGQGKRTAATAPSCLDVMKKMDDIFSEALTYTRTLAADLSPPVLRDHGLPAALKWLGEYMEKHQISVTVTVPEKDDLKLPEDQAVLLFQSARELLINSAKHAGTRQANVRLERYDGHLRIEVSDQGVGFDPVVAAAPVGTPNGDISSKFGLFSIHERMRALGGSFELVSALGKGTTATLMLPLGGGAAVRTEDLGLRTKSLEKPVGRQPSLISSLSGHSVLSPLRPLSEASTRSSALQRIRVLLVDDHPMMRQGLRSIVTAYDHLEVIGEAGDGAEAVELARRLDPDVVVMDINMPKMDGIEATQQIKANQPFTVVIGLSVNQSPDTERKMKAAGAFTYLTKESAVDALCYAIEQAVSYKQHTAPRPVR